ncbi:hypothetical protein [Flavobacterium mesophilum]|uniref:hypothetical protein n=1 Tax=Flavobacterium mesophilum TaxID=3143495 RepID=UPI0031D72F83
MIDKLKKIAGNGIAYGIYYFLLCHLLGFICSIPAKSVLKVSIPIALITLLINGLIYSRFTKREKKLRAITFKADDAVKSRLEGIANHQIEDDLVSGKLCLTDEELIFVSLNNKEYRWFLSSLASFHFYPTIFNKGGEFVIKDQNGRKIMFEVDYIKSWKKELL